MLMEYSLGKQRSPVGFQSLPKYSLNKHSFPKSVITAKFGSMCLIQHPTTFGRPVCTTDNLLREKLEFTMCVLLE